MVKPYSWFTFYYYAPKTEENGNPQMSIDQTLQNMQALGVDVQIEDK